MAAVSLRYNSAPPILPTTLNTGAMTPRKKGPTVPEPPAEVQQSGAQRRIKQKLVQLPMGSKLLAILKIQSQSPSRSTSAPVIHLIFVTRTRFSPNIDNALVTRTLLLSYHLTKRYHCWIYHSSVSASFNINVAYYQPRSLSQPLLFCHKTIGPPRLF